MKPVRLLALISIVVCLSQCSHSVRPYSDKREQSRVEKRDVEQTEQQIIHDEGKQAGQSDRARGDPDNYRRHSPMYTPATEKAYADGYREGYNPTGAANEPVRDEGYDQGFDAGMKDRARKKASDPDAHIGEYDAKLRASFERGYLEGYNR